MAEDLEAVMVKRCGGAYAEDEVAVKGEGEKMALAKEVIDDRM